MWTRTCSLAAGLAPSALRDGTGVTQIKLEAAANESESKAIQLLSSTPLESIIAISGTVVARPETTRTKDSPTGAIEISAKSVEVINRANNMPFQYHRDHTDVTSEDLKLKYRYLELRQPYLQRNIRMRHQIVQTIRSYLYSQDFLEIETPTLFRKTSEGAREFIVPTRIDGKFYTLVQSPQQYKQLLMASGFKRYFQVARCYRDEALRADRQPEFTQIDMEMAWITQSEIMHIIEGILTRVWETALGMKLQTPFEKVPYRQCMDNYGSDKPDRRFGFLLHDVSDVFKSTQVGILANELKDGGAVKAVNIKALGDATDKEIEEIQREAKRAPGKGAIIIQVKNGQWKSSITKHLSKHEIEVLTKKLGVHDNDLVVLTAGKGDDPLTVLGRVRLLCASILQKRGLLHIPADKFDFFWVVDFPLFTWEEGYMAATHHPFTAPVSADAHMLSTHPENVRGQHYDIVLNGVELGGGSIRIHKAEEQLKVFRDVLKLGDFKVKEFSHLLEALGHGCPPHGGIALGLDRLVATALAAKSIREVIAFPKVGAGHEVMTGAPAGLGSAELKDLIDRINIAAKLGQSEKN